MATAADPRPAGQPPDERDVLRPHSGWMIALGVMLILLGVLAIVFSFIATLAQMLIFGWLMLIGGAVEVIHAFTARRWAGFFLRLLLGVFYIVFGGMVLARPLTAALAVTLLIGVMLLVNGATRMIFSFTLRRGAGPALFLSGLLSVLLGVIILTDWPLSGFWAPGTFVGVDLMLHGIWLLTVGGTVRSAPSGPPGAV
jgi:uncharacterized membrane protein HdeD (DUF308 family)